MGFDHDPLLVALSLLVAIQASYVGLSLALDIPSHFGLRRRLQVAGAALSLGVGVWSMHFVGMLAARIPATVDFAVLPTLVSFLVCVLVVGAAVTLASLRGRGMLGAGALLMGLGIVSMHYIGMQALHAGMHVGHDPRFVAASGALAVAASFLALWLAFAAARRPPLLACAGILGGAIAGMHYTAMAGVTAHPLADGAEAASGAMSRDVLAAIVSVIAFAVSGIFMLALVPAERDKPVAAPVQPPAAAAPEPADPIVVDVDAPQRGDSLAISVKGERRQIAYGEIALVRANAHYTMVFNGAEEFFCPLSISEVMRRLPQDQFMRVHRSFIVSIRTVARVSREGDNGLAELDCAAPRKVPVSRNRIGELKALIDRRRVQTAA